MLQETEYNASGVPSKKIIYTIGHDQISQTTYTIDTSGLQSLASSLFFGTDGHGSVRVLYDTAAAIARDAANSNLLQVFNYDAYGNLLTVGGSIHSLTPNTLPLTTYLFSGESFDFRIGQQYLRARWYDPANGRFTGLDPFAGNSSDPHSFHKYAYVHGDPVNGVDPTGMFLASSIGVVYNNVVLGVGDSIAQQLFGLEVGLDPSTLLLSKMLEGLGVVVQWAASQLSRGLPVIEAGMFLESYSTGVSPTIAESNAIGYASSPLFLSDAPNSGPTGGSHSLASVAKFGGLPGTSGSVSRFLKTAGKLAKYPVSLIAQTGRRKVYVGSHNQLGKFNQQFGIDSRIWQRHHLSQDAAFGPLGIPYGQGLSVNLRGAMADRLQHNKFHKLMDDWWDKFRMGSHPTVRQYNLQLERVLKKVGFSPEEAIEITS